MDNKIKKEIEKTIEEHRSEYPVKLTWKQVYIGLAAITTIVGAIFSAGVKFESGVAKVEASKVAVIHQKEIAKLECDKIGLSNDINAAKEDAEFFKDRYLVVQKRLDSCLHDKVYDMKAIPETEINKEIDK